MHHHLKGIRPTLSERIPKSYRSYCLYALLVTILLSEIIIGGIILDKNVDIWSGCEQVWGYCLTVTMYFCLCIALRVLSILGYRYMMVNRIINVIFTLGLTGWGIYIFVRLMLDGICREMYVDHHLNLYVLFMFSSWFMIIVLIMYIYKTIRTTLAKRDRGNLPDISLSESDLA